MYKIYFLNKIDESAINVIAVKSMPESFDNFKNYIFGRFPPLMGQPMKFYYKDAEQDNITIINSNDYQNYLEQKNNKMYVVSNLKPAHFCPSEMVQRSYDRMAGRNIGNDRSASSATAQFNTYLNDMRTRYGLPANAADQYPWFFGEIGHPMAMNLTNVPSVSVAAFKPTTATKTASAAKENESAVEMAAVSSTEKAQTNAEHTVSMPVTSSNQTEQTFEYTKQVEKLTALLREYVKQLSGQVTNQTTTSHESNDGKSSEAIANDERMALNDAENVKVAVGSSGKVTEPKVRFSGGPARVLGNRMTLVQGRPSHMVGSDGAKVDSLDKTTEATAKSTRTSMPDPAKHFMDILNTGFYDANERASPQPVPVYSDTLL